MFTILEWFALLVYQLALSNGLTWEQGLYPFPKRAVLCPGFSFNDNIAYVLDVRGDKYTNNDNPIDPAMYKLDTTVVSPSWEKLPVSIPFTSDIQRDQSCKAGDKLYFHHGSERKLYIFDMTTDTFIDNSNIALSSCSPGPSSSVVSDGDNFVYIVGGQSGCSAYVQQYDIANNQWNVLSTSAPYAKWFWLNVALYPPQNRIYVFGGYQNSVDPADDFFDVYYFDIDSSSWSTSINKINMTRLEPIAYIPETDRIYIFNGYFQGVSIYDANTNTETFSTNVPDTVCGASTWSSAFPLNGRLQEFAGSTTGANCRTEVIYTVETVTWEHGLYPLPKRVVLGPGFSFNDNIAYVLDVRGENGDNPIDPAMYKLDTTIVNPSWQKLPVSIPFTSYIQRDQSCKVGDKLYFHHSLERKLYIFDMTTDTFIDNSNIPLSSCGPGSSSSVVSDGDNFVYIVGGQSVCSAYVQQYDIANNQWNVLSTSAPYAKWFWLNVALYPPQNRIYVFGGYQNSIDPAGDFFDVYYFDIDSSTWSTPINKITMRRLEPIAYIPETDRIYIFNGGSQGVSIYDANTNTETLSTNSPDTVCGASAWSSAFPLNGRLQEFAGITSGVNCRTEVIYTVERLCCGCSGVTCYQDRKCANTICLTGYPDMTPYNPDSYCCQVEWDNICVGEAQFVCNAEGGRRRMMDENAPNRRRRRMVDENIYNLQLSQSTLTLGGILFGLIAICVWLSYYSCKNQASNTLKIDMIRSESDANVMGV